MEQKEKKRKEKERANGTIELKFHSFYAYKLFPNLYNKSLNIRGNFSVIKENQNILPL